MTLHCHLFLPAFRLCPVRVGCFELLQPFSDLKKDITEMLKITKLKVRKIIQ